MATQEDWDNVQYGIGVPRGEKFIAALNDALAESPLSREAGVHSVEITFEGDIGRVNWSYMLFAPASVISEALAESGKE